MTINNDFLIVKSTTFHYLFIFLKWKIHLFEVLSPLQIKQVFHYDSLPSSFNVSIQKVGEESLSSLFIRCFEYKYKLQITSLNY